MNTPILTYQNISQFEQQLQQANISSDILNLNNYIGTPTKEIQQIINIIKLNKKRKKKCHPQSHP